MQCSKWDHLKCSLLSFSRFSTFGSSDSWSCLLLRPCFWISHTYQHCDFLLGLLQHVYLHCSIWPPFANAALPPHPRLQTSCLPSAHFVFPPFAPSPPPHAPGCFSTLLLLHSLTPSGFFIGMLGVFEPGALNFYTLFCLIPLTLYVSSNLTAIYFPLRIP